MEREPPPVVVTVPGRGGRSAELLSGGPDLRPPRGPLPRRVRLLALTGVALVTAGLLVAQDARTADEPPPPASAGQGNDRDGLTATASLGAARTDERYTQRLTLTAVLEPYDGLGGSGDRLLGDEVGLLDVRVRGFSVVPDDVRVPIPLGRFGRARSGRSTTVPLEAVVDDCSVEPQARREVLLTVRTGDGPEQELRAVVEPDVVRALDRLVSRTCRRPRG